MQRTEVDLPIHLDRHEGRAIPVQIADGVRDLVDSGVLRPGERIPATRPLAARWGIARGSVVAGIEQLIAEGYLTAVPGSGTIVNPDLGLAHPATATPKRPRRGGRPAAPEVRPRVDLTPGRPGLATEADPRWRAAWRGAAAVLASAAPPPAGLRALREELAAHLRQMRGVVAEADDLVVTTGARDGLGLVLELLRVRRRGLTVAVEDPGYPSLRRVPQRLGARLVEVPVDHEGIEVRALRRLRRVPDVVIVTPSHQYPLGASMSAARRHDLLAWARETDALIVEDDYDSELRYVGAPLPALAALDRQVNAAGEYVLTLGSFSRTVSGDLGAGFLYLPRRLVTEVVALRADLGGLPSGVLQRALAHYLASGGLRRRIEAMRRDHRRRRAQLARVLTDLKRARAIGMDGGLHAVVELEPSPRRTPESREREIIETAAQKGIRVVALSRYWAHARPTMRYGVVLGHPPLGPEGEEVLVVLRTIINQSN